jgi:hypothetical protein
MFEREDALDRFDAWGRAIEIAENRNHLAVSAQSYVQYFNKRIASGLTLLEPGELLQQRGEREVVLEVVASTVTEGLWIRTPTTYQGRQFSEVNLFSGEEGAALGAPEVRQIQVFGRPEWLVELKDVGDFRLEVIYQ